MVIAIVIQTLIYMYCKSIYPTQPSKSLLKQDPRAFCHDIHTPLRV